MDTRWAPSALNTQRNARIFLQPTASIEQVQQSNPVDARDISPWVSAARQSSSELTVTVNFSTEFLGALQPYPGQVINVQEDGQNLCIMYVESLSSYNVGYGVRSMTITARSRETQDIWKLTNYVTSLYPQSTLLSTIITDVAGQVGLVPSEILVPPSSISTSHTNTQLANISAWQMMQTLFLPLGQTPVMDALGRLKGISKDLMNLQPGYQLDETRLVKVNATRVRPPTSRYILQWLDPNLTKVTQQARMLNSFTLTAGYFTPLLWKHVGFSEDFTQRAEQTYLRPKTSVNTFRIGGTTFLPCFLELWNQDTDIDGRFMIVTTGISYAILAAALIAKGVAAGIPDGVIVGIGAGVTIPEGRLIEAAADVALFIGFSSMGTGDYEIWGVPFDYQHARNTSEAYDSSALPWLDNPVTQECDFIMNESHAQAVCIRELVYQARSANSWSATIVEDRRIERGDLIAFPDGSQMYVTDWSRNLMTGSDNTLDVSGFLSNG